MSSNTTASGPDPKMVPFAVAEPPVDEGADFVKTSANEAPDQMDEKYRTTKHEIWAYYACVGPPGAGPSRLQLTVSTATTSGTMDCLSLVGCIEMRFLALFGPQFGPQPFFPPDSDQAQTLRRRRFRTCSTRRRATGTRCCLRASCGRWRASCCCATGCRLRSR